VEDVIVAVNGVPARSSAHVKAMVADLRPGQPARFTVVRDRKRQDLDVRVGQRPADQNMPAVDLAAAGTRALERLGLLVRSLRPDEASEYKFDRTQRGVLVVSTLGGERRAAESIAPGELIVSVNGAPVTSVGDVNDALHKTGARDVQLKVLTPEGQTRTVRLRPN
jgi:serine protease Do